MTPEQLDVEISELETRMERLRALYEQYFAGIEKIPPSVVRKDVDRRLWQLRHENIRNTGVRFKLQTLIQRYGVYQQYWQRICRDIENGTYKRQLMRSERRSAERAPRTPLGAAQPMLTPNAQAAAVQPAASSSAASSSAALPAAATSPVISAAAPATDRVARLVARFTDPPPKGADDLARYLSRVDVDRAVDQALDAALEPRPLVKRRPSEHPRKVRKPSIPPKRTRPADMLKNLDLELGDFEPPSRPVAPPGVKPPPKPVRAEPKKVEQSRIQELHQELLRAKATANDTTTVSEKALTASVRLAEEKLRKKHGDKAIDFTVIVKDGKAVLKPVIR